MKWIISTISTIAIFGTALAFILHWHQTIPTKLENISLLKPSNANVERNKTAGTNKDLKDIIHEVQKEVVMIQLDDGSLGSGFLYNKNGDVITNAHVVNGVKNVTVKTADSREFPGTVIGISKDVDVAVVRVPGVTGETPLATSKKKGEVGDEVLALGSPLGLQNTVTTGIISGAGRDFDIPPFHYKDAYQISAPIAPGNSGGPLINSKTGEVIGINTAGTDKGTIGFSIPIVNVLPLVEGWTKSPMTVLPTISDDSSKTTNADAASPEETASNLVKYFYDSINSGDYVTAYSLLGSNWQSKTDFNTFRDGYLNTKSNSLDSIQANKDGDNVIVTATLTAEERKNGNDIYSEYKLRYTIGSENDQIKILSGAGKKIQ